MEESRRESDGASPDRSGRGKPRREQTRSRGGFFTPYKPEQGHWTRRGTFIGAALLSAWGAYTVYDRLHGYEGSGAALLITPGIPLLIAIVFIALSWRLSFGQRKAGDFMIATEGEMKKVSWSSKREVIGSTKVVIVVTALMAILLFVVDLLFQRVFQWIGVLKV